MAHQIARLLDASGIQASVIHVKELTKDENVDDDDVFNLNVVLLYSYNYKSVNNILCALFYLSCSRQL